MFQASHLWDAVTAFNAKLFRFIFRENIAIINVSFSSKREKNVKTVVALAVFLGAVRGLSCPAGRKMGFGFTHFRKGQADI